VDLIPAAGAKNYSTGIKAAIYLQSGRIFMCYIFNRGVTHDSCGEFVFFSTPHPQIFGMMIAILLPICIALAHPIIPQWTPLFDNQRAPRFPSLGTLGEQPRFPQPNERGNINAISSIADEVNWKNLIEDEVSSHFPQYAREDDSSHVSSLSSSSSSLYVELDPSEFLESLELGPATSPEEVYAEYKYGWNKQPSLERMEASGLSWRIEGDAKSERLAFGKQLEAAHTLINMN
jgi:hypothetical protein